MLNWVVDQLKQLRKLLKIYNLFVMNIFKNLKKVFTNKYWIIWVLLGFFIMSLPTYFFTWWSRHNIIFWEWDNYFYFILALDISLAIFFAIFLWATLYKMKYFSNKKVSKLCYLFRAFKYFSFFTLSMSRIKITFYNNFDICLFYNFEKFRSL